ncbi:hypothetical protein CC86DRAFT_169863 [Ophiobolus disseminans]|uniref:Uncharacterized protein n=1 Tax=Ophiobolus disseminans TaxID=1469910 RepID=A0A6A6ZBY1_9PLEO|nr:hypothetical protein CC86DRAFT_169863 [Ophiobolus disseminans]
MPTALDTSPAPGPPAPPNTPQPSMQQGSAPQTVDVENRGQAEISAAPGSQNSAASNGASIPSYGLADLGLRDSNATYAAQPDPTSNDTHTKNGA